MSNLACAIFAKHVFSDMFQMTCRHELPPGSKCLIEKIRSVFGCIERVREGIYRKCKSEQMQPLVKSHDVLLWN